MYNSNISRLLNSIKYSWVGSHVRLNGESTNISRLISVLTIKKLTTFKVCLHLDILSCCSWLWDMMVGGWSQVPALPSPHITFINSLVIGDQASFSMKPLSLLKVFLFRCISIASFTRQSTYVLLNTEVTLKFMQWCMLILCSAVADSGWWRRMDLWCSLHLALIVLTFCPMYTLLHLHRIQYTSGMQYIAGISWHRQILDRVSSLQDTDGPSNVGLNYFSLAALLDTVLQCLDMSTIINSKNMLGYKIPCFLS